MMKLLGCDICNTIADVNTEITRILGPQPDPSQYYHPEVTDEFLKLHPEVFENAKPFPGAAGALQKMSKISEIVYITARPSWAKELTVDWLERHGFPLGRGVICTANKLEVVRQLGVKMMLEDSPDEIRRLLPYIHIVRRPQAYNSQFNVPVCPW